MQAHPLGSTGTLYSHRWITSSIPTDVAYDLTAVRPARETHPELESLVVLIVLPAGLAVLLWEAADPGSREQLMRLRPYPSTLSPFVLYATSAPASCLNCPCSG